MTESASPNNKDGNTFKSIAILFRGLVALLFGMQIGAFFGLAFNTHLDGWSGLLPFVAGVMAAVYGRNRLWSLLALVFVAYIAGSFYSRSKIDGFCNSITSTTRPSELAEMAERAHVYFRSSLWQGMPYGRASDPFSMGDYGCRVEFDSSHIISHKIYID